jgi:hypothetical protein
MFQMSCTILGVFGCGSVISHTNHLLECYSACEYHTVESFSVIRSKGLDPVHNTKKSFNYTFLNLGIPIKSRIFKDEHDRVRFQLYAMHALYQIGTKDEFARHLVYTKCQV